MAQKSDENGASTVQEHGLTIRELNFATEFVKDGNATRAYEAAGFQTTKRLTAWTGALRLRGRPRVAAYIRRLQDELVDDLGINTRYILTKHKGIIEDGASENRDRIACLNACTKMLGLEKPTKHDVTHNGRVLLQWGDEGDEAGEASE